VELYQILVGDQPLCSPHCIDQKGAALVGCKFDDGAANDDRVAGHGTASAFRVVPTAALRLDPHLADSSTTREVLWLLLLHR
jgi:hypothetical protein